MKKNILIALLLTLIFAIHHAFAQETSNKASGFTVNLPDGLYLYQPMINAEPFSPLFIADNGKLIDPYALTDKIGMERFDKEYVKGKEFNVYAGSERIGTLSGIILLINNPRHEEEYSSDMIGYGRYTGEPLSDGSLYADKDSRINPGTIKAVLTPKAFINSRKREPFKATKEDANRAIDAVRKNLGQDAKGIIAKDLAKEKRKIIAEARSSLDFVTAVDLDGNGRKELIGIYSFTYEYKSRSIDNRTALASLDMLFILWDSGKVEKVLAGIVSFPAFSLGGIIDLDGDGVYELIVQISVSPKIEYDQGGKRIEVLRHYPAGWKKVFGTVSLSNEIN
ncbi:MAG: hypothetical protein HZB83_05515 [Deltaproteobacteria bacterium]|nr:hypothetical protein [Deltaproteobacteria bacterium]